MRKPNQIKIGKILKQLRLDNHYTQKELSKKVGVTTRYISDIEQDRSRASYDILIKLCNVYKVTLDEIFSDYLKARKSKKIEYSINGAINYLKKIKI